METLKGRYDPDAPDYTAPSAFTRKSPIRNPQSEIPNQITSTHLPGAVARMRLSYMASQATVGR